MRAYDPAADAAKRWPHWHIAVLDAPGLGEFADLEDQILAIEPKPDERAAVAHALAHLDLGHHEMAGDFTDEQCDDADALATVRLAEPQPFLPAAALATVSAAASLSSLFAAAGQLV